MNEETKTIVPWLTTILTTALLVLLVGSIWFYQVENATVFAGGNFLAFLILVLIAALSVGLGAIGLVVWNNRQKAYYRVLYDTEAKLCIPAE